MIRQQLQLFFVNIQFVTFHVTIVSTKISIERFDSSLYNYQLKKNDYVIDDYFIGIYCK